MFWFRFCCSVTTMMTLWMTPLHQALCGTGTIGVLDQLVASECGSELGFCDLILWIIYVFCEFCDSSLWTMYFVSFVFELFELCILEALYFNSFELCILCFNSLDYVFLLLCECNSYIMDRDKLNIYIYMCMLKDFNNVIYQTIKLSFLVSV